MGVPAIGSRGWLEGVEHNAMAHVHAQLQNRYSRRRVDELSTRLPVGSLWSGTSPSVLYSIALHWPERMDGQLEVEVEACDLTPFSRDRRARRTGRCHRPLSPETRAETGGGPIEFL